MPPGNNPIVVNISVTITQFRTLGGVFPTSATYDAPSPPPGVKVIGGNILIKSTAPTKLVFQLPSETHVFVGACFASPTEPGNVGLTEYPSVLIERNPKVNTLTITDLNLQENMGIPFNYVLFVQHTETGDIGMIDPIIINEKEP